MCDSPLTCLIIEWTRLGLGVERPEVVEKCGMT